MEDASILKAGLTLVDGFGRRCAPGRVGVLADAAATLTFQVQVRSACVSSTPEVNAYTKRYVAQRVCRLKYGFHFYRAKAVRHTTTLQAELHSLSARTFLHFQHFQHFQRQQV